ncbi:MAG: DUF1273 domain-containing protein [Ruminococcaceae bacterium]|nr:DUF1273 domain-containing protein [Oscillospiraceae bacterium]
MNIKACTFISSDLNNFSFGYDSTNSKCIALKLQIAQYINDMYKSGIKEFYSVCEQGVDLWAAEIVTYIMRTDAETKLYCIIPYEEQAAKWHNDTHELYYRVLEEATEVIFLNTHYKEDCLAAARYYTLDRCGYVFAAVVDEKKNEFVRYSKIREKNIVCFKV